MDYLDGLDIFPNNTRLANVELLKNIRLHPATISHEPLPVLTRDGYQEFLISLTFDSGYDIDYANKKGTIHLETPIMDKIIRPCMDKRIDLLTKIESKHGIKYDVSKELRNKNINLYAELFPKTFDSAEKIFVYAASETNDLPWGYKLLLTTSKRSIENLFRHFNNATEKSSEGVRELSIIPAKIRHQPIYNAGLTPTGFQIDFVYQVDSNPSKRYKKDDWLGFSVINYIQMGRFMKLMNATTTKKLEGKDISVYAVRNPENNRTIVCGIGSLDQYLRSVKL